MKKFFNYVKSLFTEDDKFIALMIGFIISIIFGVILVPLLKKLKVKQILRTCLILEDTCI